jgi:hypothetical protein
MLLRSSASARRVGAREAEMSVFVPGTPAGGQCQMEIG